MKHIYDYIYNPNKCVQSIMKVQKRSNSCTISHIKKKYLLSTFVIKCGFLVEDIIHWWLSYSWNPVWKALLGLITITGKSIHKNSNGCNLVGG